MAPPDDELRTPRLRLRAAGRDDAAAIAALLGSVAVRPFPWDDDEPGEAELRQLIDETTRAGGPHGLWLLEEREVGALIGCAGLLPPGAAAEAELRLARTSEPVIALLPAHRGTGHATETLAALVQHAFEGHGWTRLAAAVPVGDDAACRLVERVGFVPVSEVAGPRSRLRTYRLDQAEFARADALDRSDRAA